MPVGIVQQVPPGGVGDVIGGPEVEGKDYILIILCLHGHEKVGGLAVLKIVSKCLDRADRTVLFRLVGKSLGKLAIFLDRKSTRLNSSHQIISYAVFCLKKKK